jgi:RNA polymerase sigma factor (sigma-70 family)
MDACSTARTRARDDSGADLPTPGQIGRTGTSSVSPEQLFIRCLPMIDTIIRRVAYRHRLSHADAEEFGSMVRLRLLDNNCQVLRCLRCRTSIRTYLSVVIARLCLDFRISQWGKWRPSQKSRRLGPAAVLLERLVVRDGMTWEDACLRLQQQGHPIPADAEDLRASFAKPRLQRRMVGADELDGLPARDPGPDTHMLEEEGGRAIEILNDAITSLDSEDRLILKSRFVDGTRISDIAARYGYEPRVLYRRLERLLKELRRRLEKRGVSQTDIGACSSTHPLPCWDDSREAGELRIGTARGTQLMSA